MKHNQISKNVACLVLYASLVITELVFGVYMKQNVMYFSNQMYLMIYTIVFNVFNFVVMLFLCRKCNMKLTDIGFSRTHMKKSILLGMGASAILLVLASLSGDIKPIIIMNHIPDVLSYILYQIILIAFVEEVLFRGFIGNCFYVHNKVLSVFIVGLLFTLLHLPFQMIVNSYPLTYFLLNIKFYYPMILHMIFQYLYNKYHSFIAPTMFHTTINVITFLANLK